MDGPKKKVKRKIPIEEHFTIGQRHWPGHFKGVPSGNIQTGDTRPRRIEFGGIF